MSPRFKMLFTLAKLDKKNNLWWKSNQILDRMYVDQWACTCENYACQPEARWYPRSMHHQSLVQWTSDDCHKPPLIACHLVSTQHKHQIKVCKMNWWSNWKASCEGMQSNWKWSGRSACSNWCRLGVQCPSSCGKYRRELRYHTWWSHQCAPAKNARTTPELLVVESLTVTTQLTVSLFGLSTRNDFPYNTLV